MRLRWILAFFLIAAIVLAGYALTAKKGRVTVVVDAGHGGRNDARYLPDGEITSDYSDEEAHLGDSGAEGPSGVMEKDVNLGVALALKRRLGGCYDVIMTRDDDRFISLDERKNIAERAGANLFLSIHQNSKPGNCSGISRSDVYYNNPGAGRLGRTVQWWLNRDFGFRKGNAEYTRSLNVLDSDVPSLLLEVNFICDPYVEHLLNDSGNQDKIAGDIGDALDEYYGTDCS